MNIGVMLFKLNTKTQTKKTEIEKKINGADVKKKLSISDHLAVLGDFGHVM